MSLLVEYRLLQAVLNPLGDRTTLALVHWDGRTIRYALRPTVPRELEDARASARRTMRGLERTLNDRTEGQLDFGLDELLPVRGGDATGVAWTTLRRGETRDPGAHFAEMTHALRLTPLESAPAEEITSKQLERQLSMLGQRLLQGANGDVEVDTVVRGLGEHRTPLSWRNERWHRTICTVPHEDDDRTRIAQTIRRIAGVLDVAIPIDEKLVVVFPEPTSVTVRELLTEGVEYVRRLTTTPRLEAIGLPVRDGAIDSSLLEKRVRDDLRHGAELRR